MPELKTTLFRARRIAKTCVDGVFGKVYQTEDPEKRQLAEDFIYMFETLQGLAAGVEPGSIADELITDVLGPRDSDVCPTCRDQSDPTGPYVCYACGGTSDRKRVVR